jgi:hypothetical protein
MRRLRRQEAAHFTTFSRVTAEKLEYMQKLSVAEGEAHMAKVMLRTVCFQPGMPPPGPGGGSRTRSDPSSSRLPVPFQAQSELAALQNASTGAWDVADRSPPVCSVRSLCGTVRAVPVPSGRSPTQPSNSLPRTPAQDAERAPKRPRVAAADGLGDRRATSRSDEAANVCPPPLTPLLVRRACLPPHIPASRRSSPKEVSRWLTWMATTRVIFRHHRPIRRSPDPSGRLGVRANRTPMAARTLCRPDLWRRPYIRPLPCSLTRPLAFATKDRTMPSDHPFTLFRRTADEWMRRTTAPPALHFDPGGRGACFR